MFLAPQTQQQQYMYPGAYGQGKAYKNCKFKTAVFIAEYYDMFNMKQFSKLRIASNKPLLNTGFVIFR